MIRTIKRTEAPETRNRERERERQGLPTSRANPQLTIGIIPVLLTDHLANSSSSFSALFPPRTHNHFDSRFALYFMVMRSDFPQRKCSTIYPVTDVDRQNSVSLCIAVTFLSRFFDCDDGILSSLWSICSLRGSFGA